MLQKYKNIFLLEHTSSNTWPSSTNYIQSYKWLYNTLQLCYPRMFTINVSCSI